MGRPAAVIGKIRWYWASLMGDNHYRRYVEHLARRHPGSPVPSEFMLMLPYLVTIFVVAGVVGKSRAPAADGKPYIKG